MILKNDYYHQIPEVDIDADVANIPNSSERDVQHEYSMD